MSNKRDHAKKKIAGDANLKVSSFQDLAKEWLVRAEMLDLEGKYAAATELRAACVEMCAMAELDVRPAAEIAYAWNDIEGHSIKRQVAFMRPFHIPADGITVMRGPVNSPDTLKELSIILPPDVLYARLKKNHAEWEALREHWLKDKNSNDERIMGITVPIDDINKLLGTRRKE